MKRFFLFSLFLLPLVSVAQIDSLTAARLAEMNRIKTVFQAKQPNEDSLFVALQSDLHLYQPRLFDDSGFPEGHAAEFKAAKTRDVIGPWVEGNQAVLYKLVGHRTTEETAEVRHILIAYKTAERADPSVKRKRWEAKALADSLCAVINSGKTPMTDLVMPFTDDPGSKNGNLGDYGFFTRSSAFVTPFKNAGFDNPVGTTLVVETEFGFHVIQVLAKNPAQEGILAVRLYRVIDWKKEVTEGRASFPGGEGAMRLYLREQLVYPEAAKKAGTEAVIWVSFQVGTDGKVIQVNSYGNTSVFKPEAERIVSSMPVWSPAQINGKTVLDRWMVPVVFALEDYR